MEIIKSVFSWVPNAHATTTNLNNVLGNVPTVPIVNTDRTIADVAGTLLDVVFGIAGIIAVAYLVFAGISYVTAGADTEKAGKARQAIVHAVIGLIIIALAYVLVYWVTRSIGQI